MSAVDVRDDRQQFDIHFRSEAQAIETLRGLVSRRECRQTWSSWRFDRSRDGHLAARFVASPLGVRTIRRQLARSSADVVVSLPRAAVEREAPAQLTALLEQAASDFVLHVVSNIPEGDGRRGVICSVSGQLLRRCTGLDGDATSAAELRACFRRLGDDAAIAGSLGAYLSVCSEAVGAMREHIATNEIASLIEAHASANDRRLGVA